MEGTKISKNFKAGKLITSLDDIVRLSSEGRSIYVKRFKRTSPAAFVMSMQFRMVNKWLEEKDFYETEKIK